MVIRFRVCGIKQTHVTGHNRISVYRLEVILGKITAPGNFSKESLDVREDQRTPNDRGMKWRRRGG